MTTIDAAIEQVVRDSSDPDALFVAVSNLAELMGYRLVAATTEARARGIQALVEFAEQAAAGGYETDADPKPQHGGRGTCATCGNEITFSSRTVYRWGWLHEQPTADGHDAVLGGPA